MNQWQQWVYNKLSTNQNILAICVGKTRNGKSYGTGKLIEQLLEIKQLNLKFDAKHILYWTDDLISLVENSQRDIILIDESTHEFDKKRWFSFQNHVLTVLNATQGFRQNVMFIVTQNRRLISSTAWFMADYYIKFRKFLTSWGKKLDQPIFRAHFYFNNENSMAESDPKWMGDTFYEQNLSLPSQPMIDMLDKASLAFKHDIPIKLRELGKNTGAPLPDNLDQLDRASLGKLLASGIKGSDYMKVYAALAAKE